MSSSYFLKLSHFEGPLDFLLQLIRVNEVSIFEVDLVEMATQYLSYLRLIKFSDLSDASDFIAMGATLCEIKTRRLLPSERKNENGEEDSEDVEEKLKQRLIDYQLFKEAGEQLAELSSGVSRSFPPIGEWERLDTIYGEQYQELKGDTSVLLILYEQMLSSLGDRRTAVVKADREAISVESVVSELQELMSKEKVLLFSSLFPKMKSRYELVAYLLATFELVKTVPGLTCYQEDMFSPLWVYWAEEGKGPPVFDTSAVDLDTSGRSLN